MFEFPLWKFFSKFGQIRQKLPKSKYFAISEKFFCPSWAKFGQIRQYGEKLGMFFWLGQLKNMKLVNKLAQLVASLETPQRQYWTLEAMVDLLCD
jgi:hypothetical protein